MSLLSRFFRSDQKLSRPNFLSSRKECFDFSGNLVEIMDPPQTATIPFEPSKNKLDIFRKDINFLQEWGNFVEACYMRGWDFWGKGSHPKGGVICDMRTSYFPKELEDCFNQFSIKDHKKSLLIHWFAAWGWKTGAEKYGEKGNKKAYDFPVQETEIDVIEKGGIFWLKSSASYMKGPPVIKYSIPLTARHNLIITFETHAYRDVDFHSPATNLKETAMGVIDDFMNNIKVTYTEQSLKEMEAVKAIPQ